MDATLRKDVSYTWHFSGGHHEFTAAVLGSPWTLLDYSSEYYSTLRSLETVEPKPATKIWMVNVPIGSN
jgi:hypothetical protein